MLPGQASYAMGYNLAIEYLADAEKTWMLDSFRQLDARVLQPQGRPLSEWLFLEASVPDVASATLIHHAAQRLLPCLCALCIAFIGAAPHRWHAPHRGITGVIC